MNMDLDVCFEPCKEGMILQQKCDLHKENGDYKDI